MFAMDIPYVPPQEAPIVLAQATSPSADATPQPNYILKACTETQYAGDPNAAWRSIDPAYMLTNYLNRDKQVVFDLASIKNVALLEGTTHGKLVAGTSTSGRTAYGYDPTPNYEGDDRAVFLAEFEGKVYKIVVVIKVLFAIDQNASQCDAPRLIKVNKPRSDLPLDGVSVTFADLPGSSLGQTTGSAVTLGL